jgi:hypothetical protein
MGKTLQKKFILHLVAQYYYTPNLELMYAKKENCGFFFKFFVLLKIVLALSNISKFLKFVFF